MTSNVLYKDYFSANEAADYCCVSRSYFDQHIKGAVSSMRLGGKKLLFRRSDLQRFLEERWQQSNGGKASGDGTRT